jgi:putative MATE family efflux protein
MRQSNPTSETLGRSLFSMTWPMLFGVLSLMSFQLVDSAFIGQLGQDPLAALGFTLPMAHLIIGTQVGIGIATTALISRALGADQPETARRLGALAVTLGLASTLVLCGVIWLLRAPVLSLLGAPATLVPLIEHYWLFWLPSAWCGAILYFGYSVCRAHGDTRLPGLMMAVTSLVNLLLDPLFIFTFGWGLAGAAVATLIAFASGVLVVYRQLIVRGWITVSSPREPWLPALRQFTGIAGPAMFSQLLPPLASMLSTALVASLGAGAVAVWALATRLELFSLVVVLALTMSLPPMVGRLLGAGDLAAVRQLVAIAVRFVLLWQLAIALAWLLLSGSLPSLLAQDATVAQLLESYLLRVPASYAPLGICMIMVSVCNALGLSLRALLISALRLFGCYLPALWLGAWLAGLEGLFSGAFAGNVVAGLVAWLLYRSAIARLQVRGAPGRIPRPIPVPGVQRLD